MILRLNHRKWGPDTHDSPAVDPTDYLEEGAVLLLSQLAFEVRPDERDHFSPSIASR